MITKTDSSVWIAMKKQSKQKKMTIRGVEISNIQKEDVFDFCEIKGVSPEYLVLKLIENID